MWKKVKDELPIGDQYPIVLWYKEDSCYSLVEKQEYHIFPSKEFIREDLYFISLPAVDYLYKRTLYNEMKNQMKQMNKKVDLTEEEISKKEMKYEWKRFKDELPEENKPIWGWRSEWEQCFYGGQGTKEKWEEWASIYSDAYWCYADVPEKPNLEILDEDS